MMHRFASLRSDEGGVTKGRRRRDDKACDERVAQAYSCSTPRSPRKHNAVSVNVGGSAVDNLCIIPASE